MTSDEAPDPGPSDVSDTVRHVAVLTQSFAETRAT